MPRATRTASVRTCAALMMMLLMTSCGSTHDLCASLEAISLDPGFEHRLTRSEKEQVAATNRVIGRCR